MYIYAQHGHGKSDKIEEGIRKGFLSGVVLSPRNENPEKLGEYIRRLREEFGKRIAILFDPQFYLTTEVGARCGHLPDYSYYRTELTRRSFIAPKDIHRYVSDVVRFQTSLPLDRIIAPSILVDDFLGSWSQISLTMAQEAIEIHPGMPGDVPLLLSLIVDENALRNRSGLEELLNLVSMYDDVCGFYIVLNCNDGSYPAMCGETALANLMYLVYVLADVNGFEVICGFSDLVGLILHAVGAKATCTGWHSSLRQFSMTNFLPRTGGRPASPRYTSAPLLSSILVAELDVIHRAGMLDDFLSGSSYDDSMRSPNPADAVWPPRNSCLHHWEVLSGLARQWSLAESTQERLRSLDDAIQQAIAQYGVLSKHRIPFTPRTGPRNLQMWHRAIQIFLMDAKV